MRDAQQIYGEQLEKGQPTKKEIKINNKTYKIVQPHIMKGKQQLNVFWLTDSQGLFVSLMIILKFGKNIGSCTASYAVDRLFHSFIFT